MKNFEIARLFELMADILEVEGGNPFRVRAYRRAAQNLEAQAEDVARLAETDRLRQVPGIGPDLAGKIAEYLATGHIAEIDTACARTPPGVVELLQVPGVGPARARRLFARGVTGLAQLEALARAGKLRGLPGIQARTERSILRGLELVRSGQSRMPLGPALAIGRSLVRALEAVPEAERVVLAGSARRGKETVGDLDVLVTSTRPEAVMAAFVGLPQAAEVLEHGDTRGSIRHRQGIQVDLRVVEPAAFGAALVYFTGSKQHNIRLREMAVRRRLKLSEYGVFEAGGRRLAGATEEEIYAALGLPWIPPELREDAGEIESAQTGRLPDLVTLADMRGDLHCHTKASDGHQTVEALAAAARARGYEYVAVTDHSPWVRVARGLDVPALRAHVARIRALAPSLRGITVLASTECDIRPDGSLDYPDDVLAELDLVVAAVHSDFRQGREEMTRRICRALESPYVDVLAHPTGRLLGRREPYAVDLERVLATARRRGTALEINAYPDRLDLPDIHARRAGELGVLLAVNTDAHARAHLGGMELGVTTARRAWLGAAAIVNTWPLARLRQWARARRAAAAAAG